MEQLVEGRNTEDTHRQHWMRKLKWIWWRLLSSPANYNKNIKLELSGAWEPPNNSRTQTFGLRKEACYCFPYGDKDSKQADGMDSI